MSQPTSSQDDIQGLSQVAAQARLRFEGANELPTADHRNILALALEVLREPMFLLLVVAGTIYLLLGDVSDALMLLGFVFVVMGITIYQEFKTERVLEALRDLTSPQACRGYPLTAGQMVELGCEILGEIESVAQSISRAKSI